MPRRKAYTKVEKQNQIRENHVQGRGDTLYKGFQCLNPKCTNMIFIEKDNIDDDFEINCDSDRCRYSLKSGEETKFYDYSLKNTDKNKIIEVGEFSILHDDYIQESHEYKYCIVCNTMKPIEFFDNHGSRKSKRQGECRLCKKVYNSIKNQTRLTDQHREAAEKRRMYIDLSGKTNINSSEIHKRFNFKCFKCGKDLKGLPAKERPLDHTLPVYNLWPLSTENATLLCRKHNGEKSGSWPSEYYSDIELKKLSVITGISYETLSRGAQYNPEAIKNLKSSSHVDNLLVKYSAYREEIIKLRNRLLRDIRFDFFKHSEKISKSIIEKANKALKLQPKTKY